MVISPGQSLRIPMRTVDEFNVSVTGLGASDITNGTTSGNCTVVKGDGTITNIALTDSVNLFEIDDVAAPGLYHVIIPASATNILGSWILVFQPTTPGVFLPTFVTAEVRT